MIGKITAGFTQAGRLFTIGAGARKYAVQNQGSGSWLLGFSDSAADLAQLANGVGYSLPAGQQLYGAGSTDPFFQSKMISGLCLNNANQLLVIITDDAESAVQAHA